MKRHLLLPAGLLILAATPALAGQNELPAPGSHRPTFVDDALVDIESRSTQFSFQDLTIGSGENALSHTLISEGSRFNPSVIVDNFRGGLGLGVGASSNGSGCPFVAGTPVESDCFVSTGSGYAPRKALGGTLTDLGNSQLLYVKRDGTRFYIDTRYAAGGSNASGGIVTRIVRPSGLAEDVTWDIRPQTTPYGTVYSLRLLTVSNSAGYSLKYEYASDTVTDTGALDGWSTLRTITGFNRAFESCGETTLHCSFSRQWPKTTLTWSSAGQHVGYSLNIATGNGQRMAMRLDPVFRVVGYQPAGATSEQYSWRYCKAAAANVPSQYASNYGEPCTITYMDGSGTAISDGVKWAVKEGRQWNYDPKLTIGGCGCYYYNKSTDPDGRTMSITTFTNAAEPEVLGFQDNRHGRTYSFKQDDTNALIYEGFVGEAGWSYVYDGRGNVTTATRTAVANSGDSDIVTKASYVTSCSNQLVCNRPDNVTDANNNLTSATYDPANGLPKTITWPAVAGVSRQKRFSYEQRAASYYQNGGALGASSAIWLLVRESECRTSSWTGSACSAGAGDEVVTTYDYGPGTGANNLLLRGATVTADGQSRRTCFAYDDRGNRISETKPNAQLAACY